MILLTDSEGIDQTADPQADMGLHCPHMPKDTLSCGVAHLSVKVCILSLKF